MRGNRDRAGGTLTLSPPQPTAGGDGAPGPMSAGASVPTNSTRAQPAPRDPPPPPPPPPSEEEQPPPSPPPTLPAAGPPTLLPNFFRRILAALISRVLPRHRSPPRGRRRPQPKATRSVANMLRVRPPPPLTLRLAQREGALLTQWRTPPHRLRHPSPHCRHGGSTAGPARKRPSPLRLVPLGCRADTGGGLVREATGASTRLGPPPRPSAFVHRPADANRRMAVFMGFSPYLGIRSGGGWGSRMGWVHILLMHFSPWVARNSKFSKLVFLML